MKFTTGIKLRPIGNNTKDNSYTGRNFKENMKIHISGLVGLQKFPKDVPLFGKITFFNHDTKNTRDIHNIIKPLMDAFEKHLYDDDKVIVHFEGIRVDMNQKSTWFELEFKADPDFSPGDALAENYCFIEISTMPPRKSSCISLNWRAQ